MPKKTTQRLRVQLVHWNADEAKQKAARLREVGCTVGLDILDGPAGLKKIRSNPPDLAVIDLSRLPAQGRDIALAMRTQKAARNLPVLFLGGEPEKVAKIQQVIPDAKYGEWRCIKSLLKKAIAKRPDSPRPPQSIMAPYANVPLLKKLGVKADSKVVLANAPPDFERVLEPLPKGTTVSRRAAGKPVVTIWFPRSEEDLKARVGKMIRFAESGRLWIAWPKRAANMETDLTQINVRREGLAAGLVDYKICSINETYSALLFSKRKPK